jgi:hypothetical protein
MPQQSPRDLRPEPALAPHDNRTTAKAQVSLNPALIGIRSVTWVCVNVAMPELPCHKTAVKSAFKIIGQEWLLSNSRQFLLVLSCRKCAKNILIEAGFF